MNEDKKLSGWASAAVFFLLVLGLVTVLRFALLKNLSYDAALVLDGIALVAMSLAPLCYLTSLISAWYSQDRKES